MELRNGAGVVTALNVVALLVAIGGAVGSGILVADWTRSTGAGLVDATGHPVPAGEYRRIASATTIADEVLLELIDPARVIAFSAQSRQGPRSHRFAHRPAIEELEDLEGILTLRPDLVLVSNVVDPRRSARLREAGLAVFDLGPMKGMQTLTSNITALAQLLKVPARGERLVQRFSLEMASVAERIPADQRHRALYVGAYGEQLYGGTAGSSYGDVLNSAGLVDVAARSGLRDWPNYRSEELLRLDPDWIVSPRGSAGRLCGFPGLDDLRACRADRVVEVDRDLLSDPGLGMLDAARAVHFAVYGSD